MVRLGTYVLLSLILAVTLVSTAPHPGHDDHEHTHFIIHVPHHIHKHYHKHEKKIYIPVKKSEHHDHHEHHDYE
ncbi:hypothetical protein CAJAP_07401 [Camponotus japonicus]